MNQVVCQQITTFCEMFLFSDSSEESSSEDELPRKIPRCENFISSVVYNFTEEEFRKNFRMNRETFNYILNMIKDNISTSVLDRGRHTYDAETQLLVAIWYFATPDSYRSTCSRFNIGKATGLRIVRRVTTALVGLASSVIKWPTHEYLLTVIEGFNSMGFPNTIGAIDGSYIPITLPKDNGTSYINRKNFASIILQGVCDHRMLFTHCYTGEVGSVHDASVLKKSEIWSYMTTGLAEKFPHDVHLLGDKAYPCTPQLITPYRDGGNLTNQQKQFNYLHSCARTTIERAFGLLKNRWRILKFMDVRSVQWIPKYVIACCVLHNMCILKNDMYEIEILQNIDELPRHVNLHVENNAEMRRRGLEKRERLCHELT